MNSGSSVRITFEKRVAGKTVERHVFSLCNPPYSARHFLLRYGGKRSKKYDTITVTQLSHKFAEWIGGMLK